MTDLAIRRGDTRTIEVTGAVNVAGGAFDLSDGVVTFTAALAGEAVIVKTSAPGGGIVPGVAGEATVTLDPADTEDLADDVVLAWDVEIVTGAGDRYTLDDGALLVTADVTR